MKKICFLVGNIGLAGGTEKVTTLLASNIDRERYNVFILNIFDGRQPFFYLNKNVKNDCLYDEKISLKTRYIKTIIKIREYIKKNKIDTLVVVDSISCIFTIPALVGINTKHICWEHFNYNNDMGARSRKLGRYLASLFSDCIVTLTNKDLQNWKNNLPVRGEIKAIPNPNPYSVDIDHSPTLSQKTVLSVGRLSYEKGYDLLLEAWKIISDSISTWKLVIVGEGLELAKLKKMANDLKINNSVDFVGKQTDIPFFYKKASFFCLSSRFEGLPMVLLECQSFGLPAVAFNCDTGPSEIIIDNVNGKLVKNGDIEDLSKKILELINLTKDQYSHYVVNSKVNMERFEIKKVLEMWNEIL